MDLEYCSEHNWENCFIDSEVPNTCTKELCILGIDEAGRGPVLGPMVYGVCYCPTQKNDDLKALGAVDSKTITEEKRKALFELIHKNNDYIGWSLKVMSPLFISNSMYSRPKVSLNEVSHNAAAELINRTLKAGVNLDSVFVDTVGDPEKYQEKLSLLFPSITITVSKKADSLFPCVSAASICAKVARDEILSKWSFPEGLDIKTWGSGYPGDSVTKNFLVNSLNPVFGFPSLVRFSWSTAEKIMDDQCISVKWYDEDEEKLESNPSVLQYFGKKRKSSEDEQKSEPVITKRHFFFSNKNLKRILI